MFSLGRIFRIQIAIQNQKPVEKTGGFEWWTNSCFAAAAAADVSVIYLVLHSNFGCLRSLAVGTSGFRSDKLPLRLERASIDPKSILPRHTTMQIEFMYFLLFFFFSFYFLESRRVGRLIFTHEQLVLLMDVHFVVNEFRFVCLNLMISFIEDDFIQKEENNYLVYKMEKYSNWS